MNNIPISILHAVEDQPRRFHGIKSVLQITHIFKLYIFMDENGFL